MRDVYEVLRQKELEVSRLKQEVEALRVAAPLLSDGGAEDQPPLQRAVNETPQHDSGWQDRQDRQDRGKRHWPLTHESA
jgi:hypothetical protein